MRFIVALLLSLASIAPAQTQYAQSAGMDPAALARIKTRMQEFVDRGYVSGIVTLVQRRGQTVQFEAVGSADIEAKQPMRTDTLFQMMSMTKPVTGVAVMMLADEGKLRLNDAVELHLPEFRGQMMIESKTETAKVLRKPSRPITIRDLMTHTSGLAATPPPGIAELLMKMDRPLSEAVSIYAQQPLEFEPGARWMYSNPGIATLGRIVEVVSGMPYEKFLDERIFKPLGMKDSHIYLPAGKQSRLAPVYASKDGKLQKSGAELLAGDPMKYRKGAVYSGPEYALQSSAADLARFYQMMLNKGALDGVRILSPAAVEIMSQVHTGDIRAGWLSGTGFGLTWEVVNAPIGTLTGMSIGNFNHGGAFGTFGFVDPKREMVGVFLVAHAGRTFEARDAFLMMAAAAIRE